MSVALNFKQFREILVTLMEQEKYHEMRDILEQALENNANSINLNYYYGWVLLQLQDAEKAKQHLEKCVNIAKAKGGPLNKDIEYAYQAALLKTRGADHDASIFYQAVIDEPYHIAKMVAYGLSRIRIAEERQSAIEPETYEAIERIQACIDHHERQQNNDAELMSGIYNVLGMLYREIGDYDRAEEQYIKAISIKPDKHDPHHNYGHLLLLKGDFIKAWNELEYRLETSQFMTQKITTPAPMWQGEDITGKTLLIQAEQGIGDEICYMSLLQYIDYKKAKKIIIGCDKRLFNLLKRAYPECDVINRHDKAYIAKLDIDYYVMLGSLMRILRLFENGQPIAPYLRAEPSKVAAHRQILEQKAAGRTIIGFAWRTMGLHTRRRNLIFDEMKHFLSFDDYFFVLLQYKQQDEDIHWLEQHNIAFYKAPIDFNKDFDEISALTAACDGVASAAINTTHLAGALGKKTVLFLPEQPNMRWSNPQTQKTLWYPSVHIINKNGDSWVQAAREAVAFFKGISAS